MLHSGLSHDSSGSVEHPSRHATLAFSPIRRRRPSVYRTIVLQALALLAIIAGVFWFESIRPTATLTLEWGATTREFTGPLVQRMTILDALNVSARAGGIPFTFAVRDDVTEVIVLDGHRPAEAGDISVFVNGTPVDALRIHTMLISPNDHVTVSLSQ